VNVINDNQPAGNAPARSGRKQAMHAIFKHLQEIEEVDLYALMDAVDAELQRRAEVTGEDYYSARRRAIERQQSYRHHAGAGAPPVREVGIGKPNKRHAA
jgi:hypothetical protein